MANDIKNQRSVAMERLNHELSKMDDESLVCLVDDVLGLIEKQKTISNLPKDKWIIERKEFDMSEQLHTFCRCPVCNNEWIDAEYCECCPDCQTPLNGGVDVHG